MIMEWHLLPLKAPCFGILSYQCRGDLFFVAYLMTMPANERKVSFFFGNVLFQKF